MLHSKDGYAQGESLAKFPYSSTESEPRFRSLCSCFPSFLLKKKSLPLQQRLVSVYVKHDEWFLFQADHTEIRVATLGATELQANADLEHIPKRHNLYPGSATEHGYALQI
jgi:hypothetical protein